MGSRVSIISIARGFGAPESVPAGKTEKSASIGDLSLASSPTTVETICITWEYRSICMKSITSTEPGAQMRPKSLRPRSTNIKCSARSLGSASNSSPKRTSSSIESERLRVPAMGCTITCLPVTFTSASGLEPTTSYPSSNLKRYIYGLGLLRRSMR